MSKLNFDCMFYFRLISPQLLNMPKRSLNPTIWINVSVIIFHLYLRMDNTVRLHSCEVFFIYVHIIIRPRLHETGAMSNLDEN